MSEAATSISAEYSFILAAEWDYVHGRKQKSFGVNRFDISIDKRLNMKNALKLLLESGKWRPYATAEEDVFSSSDTLRNKEALFNEYLYFNSHMRKLIYNQTAYDPDLKNPSAYLSELDRNNDDAVVLYRCDSNGSAIKGSYRLWRAESLGDDHIELSQYTLPLDSIELRLYSTGVMLLALRCYSDKPCCQKKSYRMKKCSAQHEQPCKAEEQDQCLQSFIMPLQRIAEFKGEKPMEQNDYAWVSSAGRRLFSGRFPGVDKDKLSSFFYEYPVQSMIWIEEDTPITLCDSRLLLKAFCEGSDGTLARKHLISAAEKLAFSQKLIDERCISKTSFLHRALDHTSLLVIDSFNDDRMYVHGTVCSDSLSRQITRGWETRETPEGREMLKPWYGILYGDSNWDNPTYHDSGRRTEILEKNTLSQWAEYGTFHGMTYHSMVMLTTSTPPDYVPVNNHWLYYQMFLIGVLQRCSIQRFYREAAGLLQKNYDYEEANSRAVLEKYMVFLNHYWFNEVTEQEQGKEMFKRLQQAMDIETDAEFLDRVLDEVHQQGHNKMETSVNKLLVPTAILGGVWAFSEMAQNTLGHQLLPQVKSLFGWLSSKKEWIWSCLLIFICGLFLYYIANHFRNCATRGKNQWRRLRNEFSSKRRRS